MKSYFVLALVILLAIACASVQATTIYRMNFNGNAATPGPSPYVAGPGDILPAGVTGTMLDGPTNIATPSVTGFEGGNVLEQPLGASWPNQQGYRFGGSPRFPGTAGPVIANTFTIEAVIKPDLSGSPFDYPVGYSGTDISFIYDSSYHDGTSWLHATNLSVNQKTGKVTFALGMGIGDIVSNTILQSGQWYHIAAVTRIGNPQRTEMWINGVLEATGGYPAGWENQYPNPPLFVVPSYFNIGSWYWSTGRNWQGQIDAFAISDTALASGSFVLRTSYPPLMGGTVTLPNYQGDLSTMGMEIQLRPHGSTTPTYTDHVFLSASGSYGLSSGLIVTPGTYDVAFKTGSTLRTVVQSVSIPGSVVNVTLTNGDVDGNNSVGVMDHSIVSGNSGTTGNQ